MIFQSTTDAALIKAIITHPAIWPYVTDDFASTIEDYEPIIGERTLYMLAFDGIELLGMWMFEICSPICYKVHTCILPNAYGGRAGQAAKEMAEWIWENTTCQRIITDVPENNRLAYRFALKAGMTQFGLNPKCYQKGGLLMDVALLGMSRGKECAESESPHLASVLHRQPIEDICA